MEMLLAVLSVCSPEELEDEASSDDAADRAIVDQATSADMRATRRNQIKNKIRAVGRIQLMFQNLRYATTPYRWTYYTHVRRIQ